MDHHFVSDRLILAFVDSRPIHTVARDPVIEICCVVTVYQPFVFTRLRKLPGGRIEVPYVTNWL